MGFSSVLSLLIFSFLWFEDLHPAASLGSDQRLGWKKYFSGAAVKVDIESATFHCTFVSEWKKLMQFSSIPPRIPWIFNQFHWNKIGFRKYLKFNSLRFGIEVIYWTIGVNLLSQFCNLYKTFNWLSIVDCVKKLKLHQITK